MANTKISALTSATTPVAGTEVLPIVQSGATKQLSIANLRPGLGTMPTTQGGTGLTSFTANQIFYASSSSVVAQSANLVFDGTNLGIGTTPSYGLQVSKSVTGDFAARISNTNATNPNGLLIDTPNKAGGSLYGLRIDNSTTTAFSVFTNGEVSALGNYTPNTAAKGINFTANTPAAGMTSQLLNWYETGTWTPSVGGNATYYAQVGKYTRIGNIVRISGSLVINVLGTGSATTISGLPFASTGSPADFIGFSNFSSLALNVVYIAGSANGSSSIDIRSLTAAGTGIASNNVLGNGTRVDFAGTYSA
jgi:hypothetical protein